MSASAIVVVCALGLLGRSADRLPPIKVLDTPPPGVSATAEAFVNRNEGVIYLIASGPSFRVAAAAQHRPGNRGLCVEQSALKMIASIIVHEEWHVKHGSDERGAYYAQLTELNRLRLGPGTWATNNVTRAMRAAVEAQARKRSTPSDNVALGR